jgi:hypothetical protein
LRRAVSKMRELVNRFAAEPRSSAACAAAS